MANSLDALYPGRVTPGDANYPGGSIKNETTPGSSNDGTPLDKEWGNDGEGYRQGLLLDAGITPSETTDTAILSQIKNASKVVHGGAGLYQADIDYSAARNDYTKGSDGNLYRCGINNGPSSSPVDPVGDLTGAWVEHLGRVTASAWVNFDGTGVVAIRDSFNVSSITDNNVGDYTVNFATAMGNNTYAPVCSSGSSESAHVTISSASYRLVTQTSAGGPTDSSIVTCVIFGGL